MTDYHVTDYPVARNCNLSTREDDRGRLVWQALAMADAGRLDRHDRDEGHLLDCLEALEQTLTVHAEGDSAQAADACRAAEEAVAQALRETRAWFLASFAGERLDAPASAEAMDRCEWQGHYPVIDAGLRLTGEVADADAADSGLANYAGTAMIDRHDAIAGGWTVDEDGFATPPATARHEERPIEGTGWYVYVLGRDAGGPFETEADALAHWHR